MSGDCALYKTNSFYIQLHKRTVKSIERKSYGAKYLKYDNQPNSSRLLFHHELLTFCFLAQQLSVYRVKLEVCDTAVHLPVQRDEDIPEGVANG